jgi:hypothetical protein
MLHQQQVHDSRLCIGAILSPVHDLLVQRSLQLQRFSVPQSAKITNTQVDVRQTGPHLFGRRHEVIVGPRAPLCRSLNRDGH